MESEIFGNANEAGVVGGGGGSKVGSDETIRVTYVNTITGTPSRIEYVPPADHMFKNTVPVNGAFATLVSQGNSDSNLVVRAYDDPDNDDDVTDGVQHNIVKVVVGGVEFTGTSGDVTFNMDGSVSINNVPDGTQIQVFTADDLTSLEFEYVSGNTFYLGDFGAIVLVPGQQINFAFDLEVEDGDGDSVIISDAVRFIVDDAPSAEDDGVINVAEDTPVDINVISNDEFGADGVDLVAGIALTSNATNGNVVYNDDGTFTYTPNANAPAGADSFTYTITDADGDTSTATVNLNLTADSTPQVGTPTDLTVDEDGFAVAADDLETTRDDETDSTESLTDTSGMVTVDFGNDVPANLLASIVLVDEASLDTQLESDGQAVEFALVGTALVGTVDGGTTDVIRIEITGAAAGVNPGEVDYTYSVTLLEPLDHPDGLLENTDVLSGVKFTVTDSDDSSADGTFDVTIVDDVPHEIAPESAFITNTINATDTNVPLDLDTNVDDNYGADQGGSVTFAISNGTPTSATSGGDYNIIYLYTDGDTLIGSTTLPGNFVDIATEIAGSNKVFTVQLNLDGDLGTNSDSYTVTLHKQIDGAVQTFNTNADSYDFAGGNANYSYYFDETGVNPEVLLTPVEDGIRIFGNANEAGVVGGGGGSKVGSDETIRGNLC